MWVLIMTSAVGILMSLPNACGEERSDGRVGTVLLLVLSSFSCNYIGVGALAYLHSKGPVAEECGSDGPVLLHAIAHVEATARTHCPTRAGRSV